MGHSFIVGDSKMTMTWDDVAWDMAMTDLHDEAVFARATREQSIFLLVEGDSEEVALPLLFTDVIDLDAIGIKIANYNGHGNLSAALRLLNLTLSHDRPIIVTYDNDPESLKSVRKCEKQNLIGELTYLFPIPSEAVVTYADGHVGGAFEESFSVDLFVNAAFRKAVLPPGIIEKRALFESQFEPNRPWLQQLQRFAAEHGFTDWTACKPLFAETIALECGDLPITYTRLAELLLEVRRKYPVVHPDDVELPRVHGLTYFPERNVPNKPIDNDDE